MSRVTLLFDLDGTLCDTAEGITNAVAVAFRAVGYPPLTYGERLRFVGPPLFDAFREACGMSDSEAHAAHEAFRQYYVAQGIYENSLFDGVVAMLTALRLAGARLIIVTSKPQEQAETVLRRFAIYDLFDCVVGSTLDHSREEKADVIRYALAAAGGILPECCLMVGDRSYDVLGAAACGIPTVGVLYGYGSREELTRAGAVALAESVGDLAGILRTVVESDPLNLSEFLHSS